MAIDKRISYDVQGGVKNYLGKQKEVKAPVKWQSSPDHPETELAYITKAEKDLLIKKDLHDSLKGSVNRGPSGIISLNGWGSADPGQNVSGAAASAAESGKNTSDTLAAGMSGKDVQDFQSAAIAAGAGQRVNPGFFDSKYTVDPDVIARARAFNPAAFKATQGGGLMNFFTGGGLLGNIIRSIGQKFGLGKTYDQSTYDMSRYSNLPLGGSLTFENLDIRDKFDRRNTGIMENINPYKYSIGPQPVNLKTPQYFENVPYQEPDFYSNAMAGLTDTQKKLLDQRRGMYPDILGAQEMLDNISSENDPNNPATIEDIRKYYGVV